LKNAPDKRNTPISNVTNTNTKTKLVLVLPTRSKNITSPQKMRKNPTATLYAGVAAPSAAFPVGE
jgi:hypothetical protein